MTYTEPATNGTALAVMAGQAGNRMIVRWKYEGQGAYRTSHFAGLDDFLARLTPDLSWGDVLESVEVVG